MDRFTNEASEKLFWRIIHGAFLFFLVFATVWVGFKGNYVEATVYLVTALLVYEFHRLWMSTFDKKDGKNSAE